MRVCWLDSKLYDRSSRVFVVTDLVVSGTQYTVSTQGRNYLAIF